MAKVLNSNTKRNHCLEKKHSCLLLSCMWVWERRVMCCIFTLCNGLTVHYRYTDISIQLCVWEKDNRIKRYKDTLRPISKLSLTTSYHDVFVKLLTVLCFHWSVTWMEPHLNLKEHLKDTPCQSLEKSKKTVSL